MTKYRVEAAYSREDMMKGQCVVCEECDTVTEAKALAKRLVSLDFARVAILTERLRFARVLRLTECVFEAFPPLREKGRY